MLKSTLRFLPDRDRDRDRGRQDGTGTHGECAATETVGAYLDTLDLRDAIIDGDVVLQEPAHREFVLHRVSGCRAHELGRFHGAVDAWVALDELDDDDARRSAV